MPVACAWSPPAKPGGGSTVYPQSVHADHTGAFAFHGRRFLLTVATWRDFGGLLLQNRTFLDILFLSVRQQEESGGYYSVCHSWSSSSEQRCLVVQT